MSQPAVIATELLLTYVAIQRALLSVDQAIRAMPSHRPEWALLVDAQNRLMAAAMGLNADYQI